MKIWGITVTGMAGALVMVVALFAPPANASSPSSPFRGKHGYVDPNSQAAQLARKSSTPNRAIVRYLADKPQAIWVTDFRGLRAKANTIHRDAKRKKAYPVYVVYAIPHRDCGGYSAGGTTASGYRTGITNLAKALKGHRAAIILEPDALASATCLTRTQRTQRYRLLRYAVNTLTKNKGLAVYLDIGHSQWRKPAQAASLLRQAGVARARGFSLNVSNFQRTSAEIRYGTAISKRIGNKKFVVDTSRNGRGAVRNSVVEGWCNPRGRAVGVPPTTRTASARVDAYLWVKRPGESDGTCKGGPPSGQWFHERAVEMVRNRAADLRS